MNQPQAEAIAERNEFADARAVMVRYFKDKTPGEVYDGYCANIACHLCDHYWMHWEDANAAAKSLMDLLFNESSPTTPREGMAETKQDLKAAERFKVGQRVFTTAFRERGHPLKTPRRREGVVTGFPAKGRYPSFMYIALEGNKHPQMYCHEFFELCE